MANDLQLGARSAAALPARRGSIPSLAPYLEVERAVRPLDSVDWRNAVPPGLHLSTLCSAANPQKLALDLLRDCPAPAILDAAANALAVALDTEPRKDVTSVAVALLFDSRVRQPANPEAYINALTFDLLDLGFPPAVVAAACQKLRREATFIPEIAEVIEACRKVHSTYRALRRVCSLSLSAQANVMGVLAAYEAGERPEPYQRSTARGEAQE